MKQFREYERLNSKLKTLESMMMQGGLSLEEWEIYLAEYETTWDEMAKNQRPHIDPA